MYAYSLIRDQLTTVERQSFADKILNDNNDLRGETCTNPIEWRTGTVSTVAGSNIVTGSGTTFTAMAGKIGVLWIAPTVAGNSIIQSWDSFTVNDDTHLVLRAPAAATVNGAIFADVRPWATGDCGWRW